MAQVSVLMPVYNTKETYLRQAIESILGQSFKDFEFVICNDGSSDQRVDRVVREYASKDARIIYLNNAHNAGITEVRNDLLRRARGEYIAVMDHDDISLPERFAKQVAWLDTHPETGIVFCQEERINKTGDFILPTDNVSIKKSLLIRCLYRHPACMIRKSVLDKNSIRYEAQYSPAEDYALFCRLLPVTSFACLPDVLFHYRDWSGNTSHALKKRGEGATEGILTFARSANPELWAMAQVDAREVTSWRFLGIPVLAKHKTHNLETWLLFDRIPFMSKRIKPLQYMRSA